MHIEFWAVFFKMGRLLNLWVSSIFFFKENELVLFIAPRHLVGRVRKQNPVDAPLQGLSKSSALTSWIATHQKWCKIGILTPLQKKYINKCHGGKPFISVASFCLMVRGPSPLVEKLSRGLPNVHSVHMWNFSLVYELEEKLEIFSRSQRVI